MPQVQQAAKSPAPASLLRRPAGAKTASPNSPAELQKRLGNNGLSELLDKRRTEAKAAAAEGEPAKAGLPASADRRSPAEKQADLDAGIAEATAIASNPKVKVTEMPALFAAIQRQYRMKTLKLEAVQRDPGRGVETLRVKGEVNPSGMEIVVRVLAVAALAGLAYLAFAPAPVPPAVNRAIAFQRRNLQHAFRHAPDFGVHGNQNNQTLAQFQAAILTHVQAPGTQAIAGTYRGNPVTHFLDPNTQLNVIRTQAGDFLSGWRLSNQQLQHVQANGQLGGG